jgi:molybdopterin-synthase adenylyltransferase
MTATHERYARHVVLPMIGAKGQARLQASTVVIVGCGALGSTLAQLMARAGVGRLRLVDRDLVEESNLQRQLLYDEEDVASALPKADVAARRLRAINSAIQIEGVVADVTPRNVESLLEGADVVLDATDNVETRYLVNDACVKAGRPWIYGGAVACSGAAMAIRPGKGPCFRCLFEEPPPPGSLPTCDVVGILNAVPTLVASLQATEALRLLVGDGASVEEPGQLISVEVWERSYRKVEVRRDPECRCCGKHEYEFLSAAQTSSAAILCGRNSVQITPAAATTLALDAFARRLETVGQVTMNGRLLQLRVGEHELVIFPDGRVIVRGTGDPAVARSLYARYVGG